MHIAEGFLSPFWAGFWYLVALPFVIYGGYRVSKIFKDRPKDKIMIAVAGAFIFVLSALKLPSVTGSSSHPTGTGLAAILFGPGVTAFLSTISLVFQALLLAHGGITTLGADIVSMGIAGPLVAFLTFKLLRKLKAGLGISVFFAALLSDLVTYVATSIQLALAYPGGGELTTAGFLSSFGTFMGIFALTQVPLAIAEGILFVIFFDFLKKSRQKQFPEVLK